MSIREPSWPAVAEPVTGLDVLPKCLSVLSGVIDDNTLDLFTGSGPDEAMSKHVHQ